MKFDANLAWKDAIIAISANRETLLALAGVFFLLPALAYAIVYPMPTLPTGTTPQVAFAMVREHFGKAWPGLVLLNLVQAVGTLATIALLTDMRRPTVGDAIRRGFKDLLPYLGGQVLAGALLGVVVVVVISLGSATGSAGVRTVLSIILAVVAIYYIIRTGLIAPAVTVDGIRNPIEALKRSLVLTRTAIWQILLFALLITVAAFVITQLVAMAFGLLFAAVGGAEVARLGDAVIASTLGAAVSVLTAALLVSVHKQLAGQPVATPSLP